jgi:transposase InsO family protein
MDRLIVLLEKTATPVTDTGSDTSDETRITTPELKLTRLSERDDIEAYLTTFERMMHAYKVPRERWVYTLAPQLTGKAQQAFAAMATSDSNEYDKVKTAILRRYNINEETYRQRLRDVKPLDGEMYGELAIRIMDLIEKWTKNCSNLKELRELIAVEQLVNTLPTDLRIFVSERKPRTVAEAGELADDHVRARNGTWTQKRPEGRCPATGKSCHNCGKVGHFAKDCLVGGITTKTGDCVTATRTPGGGGGTKEIARPKVERDREVLRCYNCNGRGHIAAKCPSKPALFCRRRGGTQQQKSKGEASVQGVYWRGTVGGTLVEDILLDTDSAKTLIRKDLVPSNSLVEGKVLLQGVHGDVVSYPLAEVEVTVDKHVHTVRAAVSERLPVSMLLGRDVPELLELLKETKNLDGAMMVVTQAQKLAANREEEMLAEKDRLSMAEPDPLEVEESSWEGFPPVGAEFDADLFTQGRGKSKISRSQKRKERQQFRREHASSHALEMTANEMAKLQEDDPSLEAVRRAASGEPNTAGSGFFYQDGLLFRKWRPRQQTVGEEEIDQLVIPLSCRQDILRLAHEIPLSGHLGRKKTAQRVLQRFYWPNVFKDTAEFCKTCQKCQRTSPGKRSPVPLVPMPIIEVPFQRIAIDIIGPLPKSRSGHKYILVICDYATRYTEAIPLRSIDAVQVAEELLQMFSRVDVPREILTDQGSNFMSQLLAEVYRLLHVRPIKTSPYHPQTDGLVERFNQTLKSMLRKAASEEGKDWDKLFAYREVLQTSTGFSPFELLYGRQVRGPPDVLKETWVTSKKSSESVVSYVLSVQEKLSKMSELACENLAKAQRKQKRWYDHNARERKFEPGEQVLVLLPTSSNRLLATWQGPYPVLRQLSPVNYEVDMYDRAKRKRNFHVNMLRKWYSPSASSCYAEDVTDTDSEEIPSWSEGVVPESDHSPIISEHLTGAPRRTLQDLLDGYPDVLSNKPG